VRYNITTEVSDMKRVLYGVYSKEFREEAVKLVVESGLSIPEVGRRLSIPPSTVDNWVKRQKAGTLSSVGDHQKAPTEAETELGRLKRELADVTMERDLLKKAAAYFAKESQRGTRS
jgi:transposase